MATKRKKAAGNKRKVDDTDSLIRNFALFGNVDSIQSKKRRSFWKAKRDEAEKELIKKYWAAKKQKEKEEESTKPAKKKKPRKTGGKPAGRTGIGGLLF